MDKLVIITLLDVFLCGALAYCLLIPALKVILKKSKYEKIDGIIIDKKIRVIETTDGGGRFAHYKYKFTYQNKIYEIEDKAFSPNKKLNIGDKEIIYIKKDNPEIYLYPDIVRNRYLYVFMSLLGIIPLLVLLFGILMI